MSGGAVLSNGELHIELNKSAQVSKLFFPYIGSELHNRGAEHRVGIFVDGSISWVNQDDWRIKTRLPHGALVAHTIAVNDNLGILLEFDDAVSTEANIFIRNVHIVNLRPQPRDLKIFFHQAFCIGDKQNSPDSAYHVPQSQALLHYQGRRAFAVGSSNYNDETFDQFSIGRFGEPGLDGTWRDAEDGELMGCAHDSGNTDSIVRMSVTIPAYASQRVQYWLAAATSPRAALSIHESAKKNGIMPHLNKTATTWHRWLNPSFKIGQKLLPAQRQSFINNLLSTRAYFDTHGAIITDFDSDGEGLCNIHDAAYVLWPHIRLGYRDEALRFFTFCQQVMLEDGCLLPRYRADSSWGELDGEWKDIPPINPTDTAIVLFIFAQYQILHPRSAVLHDFYETLVVPMADFLTSHKYDNDTYTVSLIVASLQAAGDLAEKSKDEKHSVKWRNVAEDMRWAASNLYDYNKQMFVSNRSDELTIDGFFGAFMFGLVGLDDDKMTKAADKIDQTLRLSDGLYRRQKSDSSFSIVASLWMAQYYMETSQIDKSQEILSKISEHVLKTGRFDTDYENSPSSLVRDSAEYVSTLLDTITRI